MVKMSIMSKKVTKETKYLFKYLFNDVNKGCYIELDDYWTFR